MNEFYRLPAADIVVQLSYQKEIEIFDFTEMLEGISLMFDSFIRSKNNASYKRKKDRPRLYIREIHKGSIIAELIAIFPDFIENVDKLNTLLEFGLIMRELFKIREEEKLKESQIKNRDKIIKPLLNDPNAKLIIDFENSQEKIEIDSHKAVQIQIKSREIHEKLRIKRLVGASPIKDQVKMFKKDGEIQELQTSLLEEKVSEVWLKIESPSFNNRTWGFRQDDKKFNATILDENFMIKVQKGAFRFGKNDLLKVQLKTSQRLVGHRIINRYEIIKVQEYQQV
ncbi:hypothetical protein LH678_12230 [Acinetobacter baumannii]|uniref:hypothetical protein n=1 Tax=Acinetobacter baumannii TaxID=470 RepID=UPI001F35FA56|nr:hypothetical protein [Acinetobacter baumannii]MCF1333092.1 hypothetical protein [Acinetobacter baumannii]MDC5342010.1 hypothetical protein [Acinetobacter baumannii]MDH2654684.1 hypothetical protein [Acinetobacter baumannii]